MISPSTEPLIVTAPPGTVMATSPEIRPAMPVALLSTTNRPVPLVRLTMSSLPALIAKWTSVATMVVTTLPSGAVTRSKAKLPPSSCPATVSVTPMPSTRR